MVGKSSKKSATDVEAATKPLKKGKREAEDIQVNPDLKKQKKELIPPPVEIEKKKKAPKKVDTSSSEEDDKEPIPAKKQAATLEKESSSSDESSSSSSDEESVPEKKQPPTQQAKAEESSSDDDSSSSSDEESEPVTKQPIVNKAESSSSSEDESSDDEDSSPVKKQPTQEAIVKEDAKAESSSSEDGSSSEDEETAPVKNQPAIAKQVSKDSSSDEESEDEKKPVAAKKTVDSSSEEESSSDEESDDEEKPPLKKAKASSTESKTLEQKSSSDESSEEEKVTPKKKVDDVTMVDGEQKSNAKQLKTPGSKTLFTGNLPYRVEKSDVENFFKEAGEVVDVRFAIAEDGRPKGYGHVEFASVEAAQEAMKLNGKPLLGREIRLDFANERGAPRSSNSSGKESQSRKIFVKLFNSSLGEEEMRSALRDHFSTCGEVSRVSIPTDHETGATRGIAFIDLKDGYEKALEQSGSEISGCRIVVEEAKPRDSAKPGDNDGRSSHDRVKSGRFANRKDNNDGRFSHGGDKSDRFTKGTERSARTFNKPKPSVVASAQGKKTVFNDDE